MSAFACPRCRAPLQFERMGQLRRWHCAAGHGELLTLSTLRQLIPGPRFKAWWRDAHAATAPGLPCASCGRPATAVHHSTPTGLLELDHCKACRLVWLDADERAALGPAQAPPPGPGPDPSLSPEAREALLRMELERIESAAHARDAATATTDIDVSDNVFVNPFAEVGAPPVRSPPVLSWVLFGATVVGFFASLGGDPVTSAWGLWVDAPLRAAGLPLVTSLALSPGPFHAIASAWVAWTMADNVEDSLGTAGLAAMLVLAQLLGLTAHALAGGLHGPPVVGMGAGMAAIAVFYALRFPTVRFRSRSRGGTIHHSSAQLVAGGMVCFLAIGSVSDADVTGTLVGPPVGAAVGALVALIFGRATDADEGEPLL